MRNSLRLVSALALLASACSPDDVDRPSEVAQATTGQPTINLGRLVAEGTYLSAQTYDNHGVKGTNRRLSAVDLFTKEPNHADVYTGSQLVENKRKGHDILAPFDGLVHLVMVESGAGQTERFEGVDITNTLNGIVSGSVPFPETSFYFWQNGVRRAFNFTTVVKAPGYYAIFIHARNRSSTVAVDAVKPKLRSGLSALVNAPKVVGQAVFVNTGLSATTGTPVALVGDQGRAQTDPHIHLEMFRNAELADGTLVSVYPGDPVDFSNPADVNYLGAKIMDDTLNSGLPGATVSQYLYPAMPRNAFAVGALVDVDINYASLSSVPVLTSPNGTSNVGSVSHGTRVTITSAPQPAGQKLWYGVALSSGTTGYIASEYLKGANVPPDAGVDGSVGTDAAGADGSIVADAGVDSGVSEPAGVGLKGIYFSGRSFNTVAGTRIDGTVDFGFPSNGPGLGLGTSEYSVRWTGRVRPQYTETYTFSTVSDDGVRLWVNGQLLVDNWTLHGDTVNSGNITLQAGQLYDIKLEYYQAGGGATIRLRWQSPSQPLQVIPTARLYPPVSAAPGSGVGLRGEYFSGINLTGSPVVRTDATLNFDWGSSAPVSPLAADLYSVRWTGKVQPAYSQTYRFSTYSDDGVRVWVGGTQIINNWTFHSPTWDSGTITLNAGQLYDIKVEFFENYGGATLRLLWESDSHEREVVPSSRLYLP